MWLQGSFPLHSRFGWACATVWVEGHGQAEQRMKNTYLWVCLRGRYSEPSSTQARVGRAQASVLDGLQGSALHLNPQPGPTPECWVLVGESPSLKTRILPQRRLSIVNAVYMPQERACPSKGKWFIWYAQAESWLSPLLAVGLCLTTYPLSAF